jgi:hypothetical protein
LFWLAISGVFIKLTEWKLADHHWPANNLFWFS